MKKWTLLIVSLFFIISCSGGSTSKPDNCSVSEQNRFVYEYMQDHYLWYKELPKVDYKNYDSPEELLEDLKNEKDVWSFIIDKKSLDDYFSGKGYIGYGFKVTLIDNKLYIALVYDNSPASKTGLKRGMRIIKINGVYVDNLIDFNAALGEDKEGVKATLELDGNEGKITVTMAKKKIETPSVLKADILDIAGYKTGYLLFDKFIEPSSSELKGAFEYFKNGGIDKLIIDLRYNGGGLVNIANELVSLIDGIGNEDKVSLYLEFNDKNSYKNSSYYIKEFKNSLALDEVYFITTKNTCSASEAVINALKPYGVDVKLIGQPTCGKPVGMVGDDFCDKYIMPIEFNIVNRDCKGDYFGGMHTNCQASDDISNNLGDINENMLKSTAYLIENGVCLNSSSARAVSGKKTKSLNLKGIKSIIGAF